MMEYIKFTGDDECGVDTFKSAYQALSKHTEALSIFREAHNIRGKNLNVNISRSHDTNRYDHESHTIFINPLIASKLWYRDTNDEKVVLSPERLLIHEAFHAVQNISAEEIFLEAQKLEKTVDVSNEHSLNTSEIAELSNKYQPIMAATSYEDASKKFDHFWFNDGGEALLNKAILSDIESMHNSRVGKINGALEQDAINAANKIMKYFGESERLSHHQPDTIASHDVAKPSILAMLGFIPPESNKECSR